MVEDDYLACKVATLQLNELGCITESARTGQDALQKIQNHRYDFIYMDIGLPDMDGRDVTEKIRAYEKAHGLQPTPIIALTAHLNQKLSQDYHSSGMNEMINKPLVKKVILSHLNNLVSLTTILTPRLAQLAQCQNQSNFQVKMMIFCRN